jgi:hypothetical protein
MLNDLLTEQPRLLRQLHLPRQPNRHRIRYEKD